MSLSSTLSDLASDGYRDSAAPAWLRATIGGLALVVALAGTITAGATVAGANRADAAEQATLTLVVPSDAAPGDSISVSVLAENLHGAVAVQATLGHEPDSASTTAARWEVERLSPAAGALRAIAPVIAPESTTLAAWSCTAPDCLASAPPAPTGQFELLSAEVEVGAEGSPSLTLDEVLLIGADGELLPVVTRVEGKSETAEQPDPAAPATPGDLNGDGVVDRQDAGEAELEWFLAAESGTACEQDGHPADANGDGCLDVRDLQAYDRVLSDASADAAPGDAAPGNAAPVLGSGMPGADVPLATTPARTFVVNSTGDQDDAANDGQCRTSVGTCTLRAALTEARRVQGHDRITFDIPGPGPHVIAPATRLPYLSDPEGVTIDGYTQPGAAVNTAEHGSNAVLQIALVGTGSSGVDGLVIPSPGAYNDIRGLSMRQFRRTIWMFGTDVSNNRVRGSFVGISPAGDGGATTTQTGAQGINIQSGASDNVVGTPALADRNVLSGNYQHGVATYDNGTTRNVIQNNVVGLSPSGDRAVGNRNHGIDINTWTTDTRIGGPGPREGNVVSGNLVEGIEISHGRGTLRNDVLHNFVGTGVTGRTASRQTSNGVNGIRLEGWGNCNPCPRDAGESQVIGNTVVGHGHGAILADKGFHSSVIAENRIGILPDGTVTNGGRYGVQINHGAMDIVVRDNVVTGVENGLQVTGVGFLPNDPNPVDTFGHTFSRNAVYGISPGLGIDLAPLGAVNTAANAEPTANRGVLAPRLTSVTAGAAAGEACAGCTIEVFEADKAAGAVGSGRRYVSTATADAEGRFTAVLDPSVQGQAVTATATLPTGDTSEFSRNVSVPPPAAGNAAPTASFTSQCSYLACTFDASASADPDGEIAGYAWDFGDGTTGTGPTPSHDYAASGTYSVTLTVTDDQGATASTTSEVSPAAAPTGLLVSDAFERTSSSGWGTADIGGTYTHFNGAAPLSVSDGTGQITSASGNTTRSARLPVDTRDLDMRVTTSANQVPTGTGHSAYLVARAVANNTEYRVRLRFSGNNLGYLTVMKAVAPNFEVAIGNEVAVPGLTHEVGASYVLRASVTGADPTTLEAKAWRVGDAEPAGWQISRTDGEPVLQAAGAAGVRTYVPSSMTNLPVVHRIDDLVMTDGSIAPPPPPNSDPVASFTSSCTDLSCAFDGTPSGDPDGSIVAYEWTFGDGASGTGATPSHTYAEAGSFPVTLVVTDDRGATGTRTQTVQVTAPPPAPPPPGGGEEPAPARVLASDSFERSVGRGWGTADVGGGYAHVNQGSMSVSGGVGVVNSPSGNSTRAGRLALDEGDVDLRLTTSADQVPTGTGHSVYLVARTVATNTEYRMRLRFSGNGRGYLTVMKVIAPDFEVAIGNEVEVPGLTHEVGARYGLRASVVGTDPTTLSAKAWRLSDSEPAEWQVTRTDAEPVLQASGGVGVRTYVPASMTNLPVVHRIDDFVVTDIPSATAPPAPPPPPANEAPTAAFTWQCTDLTCSFDASESSDPEGSELSYAWDFGDGTVGTGRTTTHSYGEAGPRTVTLVVTDRDGATGRTGAEVEPTAPPPAPEEPPAGLQSLASDSFLRSVATGWGTADSGGVYSHFGGSSGVSVNGGAGLISLTSAASARAARLAVDAADVDLRITTSGNQAPTGSGYATYLLARNVGGNNEYRVRLRFAGSNRGYLTIMKAASSPEAAIGNEVIVDGLTHTPGERYVVRASVSGTDPTTISAKAWRLGDPEPADWQVTRTDAEPLLQARGGAGVRAFAGGTMTNLPLTVRLEDLSVRGRR